MNNMTTKQLKETEFRIQVCERPLVVPYSNRKYEGEEINGITYEYQSIVNNPDTINTIPELINEPEIKEFVCKINGLDGIFETFRMVVWDRVLDGDTFEKCISIGFAFRDRTFFNNYENCFVFASRILAEATFEDKGIVFDRPSLLTVAPLILREENNTQGWIMDLYISGCGKDLNSATTRLCQILNSLLPFFKYD